MLRFVLGKARSGKTKFIIDDMMKHMDQGKKLYLIVPEQSTYEMEKRLVKLLPGKGMLRLEVISFERLAYRLVDTVVGHNKVSIDEHGKLMVLRKLFSQYQSELTVFGRASNKEGFLQDFNKLLTEFRRNGVEADSLLEKDSSLEDQEILKGKLKDIHFIYEHFNAYLQDKYIDDEERLEILIRALESGDQFKDTMIWIDGFSGFTNHEFRIMEQMMLKSDVMSIALSLDQSSERDSYIFNATDKTYQRFVKIAEAHTIKPLKVICDDGDIHQEFAHFEREMFSYPYREYKKEVSQIQLRYAQNIDAEIEWVSDEINRLVMDEGYRWRDISVVMGSDDSYTSALKRIFAEHQIPYFVDEKRKIVNNPIIQFVLSTLAAISRGYDYEDMVAYFRTGLLEIPLEELEALENYMLAYGIRGKQWLKPFEAPSDHLERFNEIRVQLIEPIEALKQAMKASDDIGTETAELYRYIVQMSLPEKIESWVSALKEEGYFEKANENAQIWNIMIHVFDQLVEIIGEKKLSLKEYAKLLVSGFSEYQVGVIPPSIDHVLIGRVDRSVIANPKIMFVVGVHEGVLPAYADGNGILLDDEKQLLKRLGLSIHSDSMTKLHEEDFAIYALLNKVKERLYVSYSLSDYDGKALRPSIFVD